MTTTRELPDGTTITYTSAGRLWKRPDGDLLSVNYGPWEPVETLIDFGDQTCPACRLEHPRPPTVYAPSPRAPRSNCRPSAGKRRRR